MIAAPSRIGKTGRNARNWVVIGVSPEAIRNRSGSQPCLSGLLAAGGVCRQTTRRTVELIQLNRRSQRTDHIQEMHIVLFPAVADAQALAVVEAGSDTML